MIYAARRRDNVRAATIIFFEPWCLSNNIDRPLHCRASLSTFRTYGDLPRIAKDTTLLHGRAWPCSECEEHIAHTRKLGIMSLIKSTGDAIFPATPLLSTPHLPIALSWSSKHLHHSCCNDRASLCAELFTLCSSSQLSHLTSRRSRQLTLGTCQRRISCLSEGCHTYL